MLLTDWFLLSCLPLFSIFPLPKHRPPPIFVLQLIDTRWSSEIRWWWNSDSFFDSYWWHFTNSQTRSFLAFMRNRFCFASLPLWCLTRILGHCNKANFRIAGFNLGFKLSGEGWVCSQVKQEQSLKPKYTFPKRSDQYYIILTVSVHDNDIQYLYFKRDFRQR